MMKKGSITTTSQIPPQIISIFSSNLLDPRNPNDIAMENAQRFVDRLKYRKPLYNEKG